MLYVSFVVQTVTVQMLNAFRKNSGAAAKQEAFEGTQAIGHSLVSVKTKLQLFGGIFFMNGIIALPATLPARTSGNFASSSEAFYSGRRVSTTPSPGYPQLNQTTYGFAEIPMLPPYSETPDLPPSYEVAIRPDHGVVSTSVPTPTAPARLMVEVPDDTSRHCARMSSSAIPKLAAGTIFLGVLLCLIALPLFWDFENHY